LGKAPQEPKLLIDACLTRALVEHLLHHRGIDAVRVDDILPSDASDAAILALARQQGRVIVTENAQDFRALATGNAGHPGLVILAGSVGRRRQLELGEIAVDRMLDDMAKGKGPEGHVYEVAADGKIRRVKLPA
jgi:predicted nuclease of predicted toxin-antitoxin system